MSKPKGSASTPEQDPLHRYKSLVQPLLDRSTEAKNKKLPREQTDWWFPIIPNDYQFLAKKSDKFNFHVYLLGSMLALIGFSWARARQEIFSLRIKLMGVYTLQNGEVMLTLISKWLVQERKFNLNMKGRVHMHPSHIFHIYANQHIIHRTF